MGVDREALGCKVGTFQGFSCMTSPTFCPLELNLHSHVWLGAAILDSATMGLIALGTDTFWVGDQEWLVDR